MAGDLSGDFSGDFSAVRNAGTTLRSLVARRDSAHLVARLQSEPWPAHCLQLIGDGVLAALEDGVRDGGEVAREVVSRLRDRRWEGDEELARQLESGLGTQPSPLLRPVPTDLEDLSMVLEGDPVHGGGVVDLETGEVWPEFTLEESAQLDEEDLDDGERWLWVAPQGSRDGYRDMEDFIAKLDDEDVADRLSIAISGRGAFRRFKDTLARWPELMTEWHAFSDDRQRGRARRWLADHGYRPVTRRG